MTLLTIPQHLQDLLPALEQALDSQRRVPVSTYRLQFNADFTFAQAQHVIPYLHALGVTDCYASPYLQARAGSTHGYDIVDPQAINPELGGPEAFNALARTLKQYDMGLLMDIVPNHLGVVGGENKWWYDVLEHGLASTYAAFFDITWQPRQAALRNKVLLPILGSPYGETLRNQDLRLIYAAGTFELHYYDHRFPINLSTAEDCLSTCLADLQHNLGEHHPQTVELQNIISTIQERQTEIAGDRVQKTMRSKQRLAALYDACSVFRTALTQVLHIFNGAKDIPQSFDRLHALLEAQAYRLSDWRLASEALNYRRFFDITHLAGVRVEEPRVFNATHDLILRLLAAGEVTGLRVDHPDGLFDPAAYFKQLQRAYIARHCQRLLTPNAITFESAPSTEADALAAHYMATHENRSQTLNARPLYIVVEKILEADESLPEGWLVEGNTGYDFLNQLNGLFIDQHQSEAFTDLYAAFIGEQRSFEDILYAAKKRIMQTSLASEVEALGEQLLQLAERERNWRDSPRKALSDALHEIIACFPVYRTYLGAQDQGLTAPDRTIIDRAIDSAQQRSPTTRPEIWAVLHDVLMLDHPEHSDDSDRQSRHHFVMKFQQTTGPVMAKSLEDTAFYQYVPLTSLNEVGGDPVRFGNSVEAFHQQNLDRLQRWPGSLLGTSTHDTKRSEDIRARLNSLSEIPEVWRDSLWRWRDLNQPHRSQVGNGLAPSRQEEYFLYQTLLGAWPLELSHPAERIVFQQRIQDYMRKALREAKVHTTWTEADLDYEAAVEQFIGALLDDTQSREFLQDFDNLQQSVAQYGMWNALAQILLKATVPGVPDLYQGCELWDLSLVDPDNRRQVDYTRRQAFLEQLEQRAQGTPAESLMLARDLLRDRRDGRIKLYVTWHTLCFRRAHPAVFQTGDYIALDVSGSRRDHLIAFARLHHDDIAIILVPRLPTRLVPETHAAPVGQSVWQDTHVILPEQLRHPVWRQLFTAETLQPTRVNNQMRLSVGAALAEFPVALLTSIANRES